MWNPIEKPGFGATIAVFLVLGCGGGTEPTNPPSAPLVTTVEVTAPNAAPFMGDTLQLTATVKDQLGAVIAGKTVTWSSGTPAAATVDTTGRVILVAAGSVTITATVEAKSGAAVINVTGPGTQGGASGTALIGSHGGTVPATLPGGGNLSLTIPSAALSAPVQVTLDPVITSGGALAAFRISPVGLRLAQPATLVIKVSAGAKVRATTVLVFEQDGQAVPVPGIPNLAEGTVTVSLTSLGLPAAVASGSAIRLAPPPSASAGAGSFQATLMNMALGERFNAAESALLRLQRVGTVPTATAMESVMQSLLAIDKVAALADSRFGPLFFDWTIAVCGFTDFALHALQSFGVVSDYRGLERVAGDYLGWSFESGAVKAFRAQVGINVTCPTTVPDAETEILTKLQSMRAAITVDLDGFVLTPSPRDSLTDSFLAIRLGPLLSLAASLRLASFDDAAQLVEGIVTPQLSRIRTRGYGECFGASQEMQGLLIRHLSAGGLVAALAPFDAADLESDIELCGMKINWRMLDSTGAAVGNGTLGSGGFPGSVLPPGNVSLSGDGKLELSSGFMKALRCPSPASANAEQLEVAAGLNTLTRISVVSPSNSNDYLPVSPLLIPTSALRSAAGIAPDSAGTVKVVVRRIGGLCSGRFANIDHSTLGTLNVTFASGSEVLSVGGAVGQIPAPASVVRNARESNTAIALFRERATRLTNQLNVDISAPGTFSTSLSPGNITAGTDVISYFLHIDPVGNPGSRFTYQGTVTFTKDILGVISRAATLDATDGILGAAGTGYPTGDIDRSTPVGPGNTKGDQITLSANRRTLTFTMLSSAMGQIRIVLKK